MGPRGACDALESHDRERYVPARSLCTIEPDSQLEPWRYETGRATCRQPAPRARGVALHVRRLPRRRGAGRPRGRTSRSSSRGGDADPGDPEGEHLAKRSRPLSSGGIAAAVAAPDEVEAQHGHRRPHPVPKRPERPLRSTSSSSTPHAAASFPPTEAGRSDTSSEAAA